MSHIIMPLEMVRVRADKFQLSKCNARIHTGFVLGEVGGMCDGGGGGRHRRVGGSGGSIGGWW